MKLWIAVGLFVIALGAITLLSPPVKVELPVQLEVLQTQPSSAPIATQSAQALGQKLYTNTQQGYLLKYPQNWQVESEMDDTTVFEPTTPIKLTPNDNPDTGKIFVVVTPTTADTPEAWLTLGNVSTGLPNKASYAILDPVVVDGIQAVVGQGGCCGFTGRHTFVVKNKKLYDIAVLAAPQPGSPIPHETVYADLVKSFTFVND